MGRPLALGPARPRVSQLPVEFNRQEAGAEFRSVTPMCVCEEGNTESELTPLSISLAADLNREKVVTCQSVSACLSAV